MSNYYRKMKKPWRSLRADEFGTHTRIAVWCEDGGKAGELVVDTEAAREAVSHFFEYDGIYQTVSKKDGLILKHLGDRCRYIHPWTLLDDYGQLTTYRTLFLQVRGRVFWVPNGYPDPLSESVEDEDFIERLLIGEDELWAMCPHGDVDGIRKKMETWAKEWTP